LESERESAQLRQQAADEIAKATNTRTRAERAAATMISQAEKQVSEIKAEASRQVEQVKREASELLHAAQERSVATDTSIRQQINQQIDEAERARAAIHEEADNYASKAYQQADDHVQNAAKRAQDLGQEADTVLETSQRRADELTNEARSYAERLISETVQRSRAIARDTEELVGTMLSDTESQLSDVRRQQGYLNEYLQRMRQAATEVDMEITNIQPPRLIGETKPITKGGSAAEELPEEVAITVDVEVERTK
jgi:ElaB/YqjD/DUF883 family membrane-anchored ribosome-binding protein